MKRVLLQRCELLEQRVALAETVLDLIDIEVHTNKTVLSSIGAAMVILDGALKESAQIASNNR